MRREVVFGLIGSIMVFVPSIIAWVKGYADQDTVLESWGWFIAPYSFVALAFLLYARYRLGGTSLKFLFLGLGVMTLMGGVPLLLGVGLERDLYGGLMVAGMVIGGFLILYGRVMAPKELRPNGSGPGELERGIAKNQRGEKREIPRGKQERERHASPNPREAEALFRIAEYAERASDLEQAVNLYSEAAELDPTGLWGANAQGRLAELRKNMG